MGPNHQHEHKAPEAPVAKARSSAPAAQPADRGIGNLRTQRVLSPGAGADPHEREADRVALQVVSRGAADRFTPPPIGRADSAHTRRAHGNDTNAGLPHEASLTAATRHGRPLDTTARAFFESRFGRNLEPIRVHTGAVPAQAARAIDALAFTHGPDIVFADGEYRPDTLPGRFLLAHELTHALQQQGNEHFVQRADKETARVQAQVAGLEPAKEAPKPGADAKPIFVQGIGTLTVSTDRAYMRRMMAELIGKHGGKAAQSAVEQAEDWSPLGTTQDKAIAALMREMFTALQQEVVAVSAEVRNAAIVRLQMNYEALGDWSTYVTSLAPTSLMDQTLAAQELTFMQSLAARADPKTGAGPYVGPYDMRDLAEMRAWSTSPGQRLWVERLNKGEIHGGCMDCHVRKSSSDYDSAFAANDPARMAPVYRLAQAAQQEGMAGPGENPRIHGAPVQGVGASEAIWNYAQGRPGLTSIAESATSIAPKIMPLVTQYKVVPDSVINRLYTPGQLVAVVQSLIAERRAGYLELKEKVADAGYNFLELKPIVDGFLGSLDPDVHVMIKTALDAYEESKKNSAWWLAILAFLLTIFPPTAPLGIALGVGLAVSGLIQGYLDYEQGLQYWQGTGAGVFSPEQEASAGAMMAGGIFNMAMSGFALVGSAVSVGKGLAGIRPKPTVSTALARPGTAPVAGEVNAVWKVVAQNPATGDFTVVGKNLAAEGAGELVTVRVNIKTGMGTATLHGPNGMTVPIVNGKMQFPAGLLPEAVGEGAPLVVPAMPGAPAAPGMPVASVPPVPPSAALPPGVMALPAGQGPSFMRPYLLPAGGGIPAASARPQLGSRVILPSPAPGAGEAPVYAMPLGPESQGGVRLMNRGLRPSDFPNSGLRGPMIADDELHLAMWLRAEAKLARSAEDNIYKEWQAAVKDGTVATWNNKELGQVFAAVRKEYFEEARALGIDIATIHHWNYNKNLYPEQVVDPRNLMPIYGRGEMRGTWHPAHQGGLHPLTSSGHPTTDPIDPIHELPLYNYNVPGPNPAFPGMPEGWHPPMLPPEDMPFGWDPQHPPIYDWPGGVVPVRPPR
jgi:hypothetical protein